MPKKSTQKSTLKTKATDIPASDFIAAIEHKTRQADALVLLEIFERLTGDKAVMWNKIVGFGRYDYVYDTGNSGTWMKIAFAANKANMTVYLMDGFSKYAELLDQLGKHRIGKSCLYINKLADVDLDILEQLIIASWAFMSEKYD